MPLSNVLVTLLLSSLTFLSNLGRIGVQGRTGNSNPDFLAPNVEWTDELSVGGLKTLSSGSHGGVGDLCSGNGMCFAFRRLSIVLSTDEVVVPALES